MSFMKKNLAYLVLLVFVSLTFFSGCIKDKTSSSQSSQLKGVDQESDFQDNSNIITTEGEKEFVGSLEQLAKSGQPITCVWDDQESQTSGKVFIDGKKSYVESKYQLAGKEKRSALLTVNEYVHSWDLDSKTGFKMPMLETKSSTMNSPAVNDDEDFNQSELASELITAITNYRCKPWSPDQSYFQIPQDVNFQDLGTLMETSKQKMSDVCNILTGEEKTACLEGINQ